LLKSMMPSPMGNGDCQRQARREGITLYRPVTVKRTTIADERLGVVRQTIIYLDSARADSGQDTSPNEMVGTQTVVSGQRLSTRVDDALGDALMVEEESTEDRD
jgi:hypothetical protein